MNVCSVLKQKLGVGFAGYEQSVCDGDAESPFRPYGGSLFGKRPKK
jgi:hypothetical protein